MFEEGLLVFEEGLSVFEEGLLVLALEMGVSMREMVMLVFEMGVKVWAVSVFEEELSVFEDGLWAMSVLKVGWSVLRVVRKVSGGRGEGGKGAGFNFSNQAGRLFTWQGRGAGGGGLLNLGWRRKMGKTVLPSLRARKV